MRSALVPSGRQPCALSTKPKVIRAEHAVPSQFCLHADGTWAKWHLETKNGEDGIHWIEAFKPVYFAGVVGNKAYKVATGLVGRLNPFYHSHHKTQHDSAGSK